MTASSTIPVFEEHGEVLAAWHERSVSGSTLICFDRHLDVKAIAPAALEALSSASMVAGAETLASLNRDLPFRDDDTSAYGLDNFLYAALRLGMVRRLVWVKPDLRRVSDAKALAPELWSALSLIAGHSAEIRESFMVSPAGPCVRIAGGVLHLTTIDLLPLLHLSPDTIVDVDLDFFGTEDGVVLQNPCDVAAALRRLRLERIMSITCSISSGFLAPSLRWLARAFADHLGRPVEFVGRRANPAAPILRLLALGAPVSCAGLDRLVAKKLSSLGGPGWSLASVLASRSGDASLAEKLYWCAREACDGAHWPAYALGMHFLGAGDPAAALPWFQRAQGMLIDTIQLHSLCMEALCLARSGRYTEAFETARRASNAAPLRREPYIIATIAAERLGDLDTAADFRRRVGAVTRQMEAVARN